MITVYSKNDCPACKMLKKQLDSNAIAYQEINVDTLADDARDETIAPDDDLPSVDETDDAFARDFSHIFGDG